MGAGNSCVPPHTPVVWPLWPAMVSGMGCNFGPSRHMPGIFGPKICLAYAQMPLCTPTFPSTAALREWVLERCRPGFKERASASSSTPCNGGPVTCAQNGADVSPKCPAYASQEAYFQNFKVHFYSLHSTIGGFCFGQRTVVVRGRFPPIMVL